MAMGKKAFVAVVVISVFALSVVVTFPHAQTIVQHLLFQNSR